MIYTVLIIWSAISQLVWLDVEKICWCAQCRNHMRHGTKCGYRIEVSRVSKVTVCVSVSYTALPCILYRTRWWQGRWCVCCSCRCQLIECLIIIQVNQCLTTHVTCRCFHILKHSHSPRATLYPAGVARTANWYLCHQVNQDAFMLPVADEKQWHYVFDLSICLCMCACIHACIQTACWEISYQFTVNISNLLPYHHFLFVVIELFSPFILNVNLR